MKSLAAPVALVGLILAAQAVLAADKPKLEPTTVIVAQADAPLAIESYSAVYRSRSQYVSRGIHHDAKVRNVSDQPVVAYAIKFVSFNVFNEYLNNLRGYAIETLMPGDDKDGSWVQAAYAGPSFQTGVAYVAAARFADGSIWMADESVALEELRKIEADFEAVRLEEEKEE